MTYKTEITSDTHKCLLIAKKKTAAVLLFDQAFKKYNIEIFFSNDLPKRIDHFDYICIFNPQESTSEIIPHLPLNKKILIILDQQKEALQKYEVEMVEKQQIKLVNVDLHRIDKNIIDKILWFFFSKSQSYSLDLQTSIRKSTTQKVSPSISKFSLKKFLLILFTLFVFIELLFIFPFALSAVFMSRGINDLKMGNWANLKQNVKIAVGLNKSANDLYHVVRPTYSFFYLALLLDDMFLIENKSLNLLTDSISMGENGQRISYLFFHSPREHDKNELKTRFNTLKKQIEASTNNFKILGDKLTNYNFFYVSGLNSDFETVNSLLSQINKMTPHLNQILGENSEKKYLIFFQNNMEIRPGGGFIGSYAIINVKDFSIVELKIEDVYETDGRLKIHFDPPDAINQYLKQPHWFLRDSNFSPDFQENFKQTELFLIKSINVEGFDGGVALTTTAITNLLEATGPIYLSDYGETINKDNFYIKTQIQSENDFFPGSKQKKNYLSTLTNAILAKLDTIPLKNIATALKKSLDEKQMVLYFKYTPVQKDIEQFGYSGKIAALDCAKTLLTNEPCIADGIVPIDANLGVNKANFFVKRLMTMKIKIKEEGQIEHLFSTTFINNSSSDIYPGGSYKNYHQIYLPRKANVKNVYLDTQRVNDYEIKNVDQFKIISLLIEIAPQQTKTVKIEYDLKIPDYDGKMLYQLVVQKQIGALNNDLVIEYNFDRGIRILRRNFTALAKGNSLIYNTTLSNDRIFLVEFTKK